MRQASSPTGFASLARYERHLAATAAWIERSVRARGGSSATFSVLTGWSRPYPETTGYLIPTLLDLSRRTGAGRHADLAGELGRWLLAIQNRDGGWSGGAHPPSGERRSSFFNTAQILRGLLALHAASAEASWLDAARRAGRWLASGIDADGHWPAEYRASRMPSYYASAAAPLLQLWRATGAAGLRSAARRVLDAIVARRNGSGAFPPWGFESSEAAPTHTIAYTLAGLLEAATLLDDWGSYGAPARRALDRLAYLAELHGGRLPGALDDDLGPSRRSVCLTGNAQIVLCLLALERHERDLRLVNAACKLTDFVCRRQSLSSVISGRRGGVAGSAPIWGSYMRLRYPNWAAKFHCDALMALGRRLGEEAA